MGQRSSSFPQMMYLTEQSNKPYTEFDDTNPLTVYGRSKRAGENYVKEFTHKHFIIRSNWVYGKGGNNFVNRVLNAAEKG